MSKLGPQDPKFILGDFLITIPSQYIDALAAELRREPAQLRLYREVADLVQPARRVRASWSVHRDLRNSPHLLSDGLTVRAAAALAGKGDIDSRPERLLSVEERAERVRQALADPQVHAVIDNELSNDRRHRAARRLAGRVVSEHTQRKRELENELRQLRETMSPLEATVKAELQIAEMSQLLEVIAELFSSFENPERIVTATIDLQEVGDKITTRSAVPQQTAEVFRI